MKNYFAIFLQMVGFIILIWGSFFGITLGNITWFSAPNFVSSTYLGYDAMVMNAYLMMGGSFLLCVGSLLQCNGFMEWGFLGGMTFFVSFLLGLLRLLLFPPNWSVPGSGFQVEMLIPFEGLFVATIGLTLFALLCYGFNHRFVSRISFSRSLSLFLLISIIFVVLMAVRGILSIGGAHGAIPYPVLGELSILLLLPYSLGLIMTFLGVHETKRYS